ncbi:AAA family ATPase [Candidatus Woesearchaeota archaeon]|nr:MAG: AAA family ATPase [Candidatus Woesearchaeota archaeon]
MEWYEELDFDENPFKKETKTVGYDDLLDDMMYGIVSGHMMFIEGAPGSGKTKLLKEAIRRFGGHGKVIYVNCKKLHKELNVERLLKDRYGWFATKVLNKKPKNMILLLDEVEHLSQKNCERIKYYYDQNYLRAVVFAGTDFELAGLNESIQQRIHKKLIVKELSDYEAVQVVREKIGEDLLSDRVIKYIYNVSNKNNKKFLENCETVCKVAAKNKDLKEEDVDKILEESTITAVTK